MSIKESIVEQAALDWLKGLGYEVLSGLTIAPGEPAAERSDYRQVFLFDRLQTKLEDLNTKIPLELFQEPGRETLLPKLLSGELRVPPAQLPEAYA
jgi:type I restriction enzyme R subunit